MVSNNSSSKLSKKKVVKKPAKKKSAYPKIYSEKENNYISIKLKAGVEAKSYLKKGVVFSENEEGEVIEIQILS